MESERCEAEATQSGMDKGLGLLRVSGENGLGSSATIQKMKVDVEDLGSKIESPTPEKPESRRKGPVITSLARNLLAEKYQGKTAGDESQDKDNADILSPSGSPSSVSGCIDELPEKYGTLLNLFNRLDTSIRLLRLQKKMTTFKMISKQVEILTKRKFKYSHLAQMKYLFPEAIGIKKILLHDAKSLRVYPDMEISLLMDAVESNADQSPSMALCRAFRSRLLSFLDAHHKDVEIPEVMLPEPFNLREKSFLEKLPDGSSAESLLQSSNEIGISNAFHFPRSFNKLMSRKIIAEGIEKTQLLSYPAALSSLSTDDAEGLTSSPNKQDKNISTLVMTDITATPNRPITSCYQESTQQRTSNSTDDAEGLTSSPNKQDKNISTSVMTDITATPNLPMTSCYQESTQQRTSNSTDDAGGLMSSPNKQDKNISTSVMTDITATPNRPLTSCYPESTQQGTSNSLLMAETPAMQIPKRPLPTPLEKLENPSDKASEAKLTSSARRLLLYSPSKFEGGPSGHDEIKTKSEQDETIHHAKHPFAAKEAYPSGEETSALITNSLVDVVCCSANDKINQASRVIFQDKLALAVTFDTVCIISQSTSSSLITKQELVHKILANNLEIEETREVEEHLAILEELVPDCITKKVVLGGEILYRIKHISDPKSVRARLVEAI